MDIVFLDIETTGLDPRAEGASVLEVAAARVCAGRVVEAWSTLCYPAEGAVLTSEAAAVNGLTLELCRAEGVAPWAWRHALRQICRGARLVAHYAPFERAWLGAQADPDGGLREALARPWACSKAAVKAADAQLGLAGSTSLDPACERYGVPYADGHTALGDALSCARLWAALEGRAARWSEVEEAARVGAALEMGEGR